MNGLPASSISRQLETIWSRTQGDPRTIVAVLDGAVDLNHPCFAGARVTQLESWIVGTSCDCNASQHGTHVASVIFGQHEGPVRGIAPRCRGISVPVFEESESGELLPCSQLDLARAIAQAVEAGARIINISGGQLEPSGQAEATLARAIEMCANRGVLVVAAAGNDGCPCLHVPAALPNVLVAGAMDDLGQPLGISNWGDRYATQGVLAPGESILGALPGGDVIRRGGTSFATPIVSGVAALLMSIQMKRGEEPNAPAVRRAILDSAIPCDEQSVHDCRRFLGGRLNIVGAFSKIQKGADIVMTEHSPGEQQPSNVSSPGETTVQQAGIGGTEQPTPPHSESVGPAAAPCPSRPAPKPQVSRGGSACPSGDLVFALGQLGYDFGTEANRDYYVQQGLPSPENRTAMAAYLGTRLIGDDVFKGLLGDDPPKPAREDFPEGRQGDSPYCEAFRQWEIETAPRERTKALVRSALLVNKADASGLTWTLVQDLTPIYVLQPGMAFGLSVYDRLVEFFEDQENGRADQVAVAGRVVGQTRLINGQVVPVVCPDIRGMYNWAVDDVVEAAVAAIGDAGGPDREAITAEIKAFAERVYYDFRNLGVTAQERALNYAATNLFQAASAYAEAVKHTANTETKLDDIDVERSPICREGSDCWDVKLTFFNPKKREEEAKRVFRFTVDVSGVIPVTVGDMRSWYVY
jgi:hypothetical protein